MSKRMIPYELGKLLCLLCELAGVCGIAYGAVRALWFVSQWALSPLSEELMLQVASAVPEKFAFAGKIITFFTTGLTADQAKAALMRHLLLAAGSLLLLLLARLLLRLLEQSFKQRFMPVVLQEDFDQFTYRAKKAPAEDEILCDVGLLSRVERYYTANRLEGLYRDCWVASQEIICGGVYGENYTSHTVKVRGQWLAIQLNREFSGTIILETRGSKNRFSHRSLAGKMCQIQFTYAAFNDQFVCYTDSTEDTYALLTREMADKLLSLQEKYPDLCVIFRNGCIYALIRRRSFNRRWELAIPFCRPWLRREAMRLYGSVEDLTDLLLA